MHISKKILRSLIKEEINILLEEEGDEEEIDFGDEEGGDEDVAAEEEGGDEDVAAEEEEKPEPTPEEEASLSKSADDQILSHIIDFETNAIKSATVQQDDQLRPDPEGAPIDIELESRWYKSDLSRMLFEEESEGPSLDTASWVGSPDIDVAVFASDIARLVMNYDSLIDMEALILNKAQGHLIDKYDQVTSDYFIEIMDVEHDMRTNDPSTIDQENEGPQNPSAIGAGFATQVGGGA